MKNTLKLNVTLDRTDRDHLDERLVRVVGFVLSKGYSFNDVESLEDHEGSLTVRHYGPIPFDKAEVFAQAWCAEAESPNCVEFVTLEGSQ